MIGDSPLWTVPSGFDDDRGHDDRGQAPPDDDRGQMIGDRPLRTVPSEFDVAWWFPRTMIGDRPLRTVPSEFDVAWWFPRVLSYLSTVLNLTKS